MKKRSKATLAVLGVAALGTTLYFATPSFSEARGFGYGPGYGGGPCGMQGQMNGPMGPGGQGFGGQGFGGPGYGGQGSGPQGMMMNQGYGPRGMMGQGFRGHRHHQRWANGGFGRDFGPQKELATPLTVDDVRAKLERRLDWRGNDRLKVGKVEEQGNWIIAEIVTVDDFLVRKIKVDPKTGRSRPIR